MTLPRWCLLLAAVLALGACRTLPEPTTDLDRAAELERWTLEGRLGYRSGDDGGSASFRWVQADTESGRIHFSGPMGFGSARLDWAPGHATLEKGNDEFTAPSPGMLAWHLTGLVLPIDNLLYWVRGLPAPSPAPRSRQREDNRLIALEQSGWSLTFERYRDVAGLVLPHRIKATQGDQRFTLVIQSWQPAH